MKPLYLFFFLLLAGPLATRAQADFRPGYIILPAGDTVRGILAYGRQRSASECSFKTDPAAAVTRYLPTQLKGYGFLHDRFFQSHRAPVTVTATDSTTQRVFLEVLVQGAATLFYLSGDNQGDRYFLRSGQGPIQPLAIETSIVEENGSRFKQEKALYRGVLADAFRACPALQGNVSSVALNGSSLVRIVREYNTCVGGSQQVSAVAAAARRSYVLLEAVGGGQLSTLRFEGRTPLHDQSIAGGIVPVVGLALQQHVPVLSNRFGLRAELLYQRQHYQQEFFAPTAQAYEAYQEVRVAYSQLRVPIMLRYAPFNGRFRPFVAVGGSISFGLNNSNEVRYRALPTSDFSAWKPLFGNPRGIEEGLLAGIGGTLELSGKRLAGAELRAEGSNGFSEATAIGTPITRFLFLLSMSLSRAR